MLRAAHALGKQLGGVRQKKQKARSLHASNCLYADCKDPDIDDAKLKEGAEEN